MCNQFGVLILCCQPQMTSFGEAQERQDYDADYSQNCDQYEDGIFSLPIILLAFIILSETGRYPTFTWYNVTIVEASRIFVLVGESIPSLILVIRYLL